MLSLKGIYYQPSTAEKPILEDLTLVTDSGGIVIISGSSGSGKTTLVEIISGLSGYQKGEIKWHNKKLSARQRRWLCGLVFQFPERYFLGLTVGQELRIGHKKLSNQEQVSVLKEVGLDGLDFKQPPEQLSGGQQRRLAIAVQLLRRPKVLLLDEPTAGLDWSVKNEVIKLLLRLRRNQTILVVTHEPELFKSFNIESYELRRGQLHSQENSSSIS